MFIRGIAILFLAISGCGGGTDSVDIVPVSGFVTLDNRPVAGALVEFMPDTGRPSAATTSDNGHFDLVYTPEKRGALIGFHTVRITAGHEDVIQEGKVIEKRVEETIPSRYNVHSTLRTLVSGKDGDINFSLQSQ